MPSLKRIFKAKPFNIDFGIIGYELLFTQEELGIPPCTTEEESRDAAAYMAFKCALATHELAVAEGLIPLEESVRVLQIMKQSLASRLERVEKRKVDAKYGTL